MAHSFRMLIATGTITAIGQAVVESGQWIVDRKTEERFSYYPLPTTADHPPLFGLPIHSPLSTHHYFITPLWPLDIAEGFGAATEVLGEELLCDGEEV